MAEYVGLQCPNCKGARLSCIDSRPKPGYRFRRYQCEGCGHRFNTTEITESLYSKLVKVLQLSYKK